MHWLVAKTDSQMLRLTLLLCFGMLAALFTLGEDRGQVTGGVAVNLSMIYMVPKK